MCGLFSYFEVEEPCKKEKEVIALAEVIFLKQNVSILGGCSVSRTKSFLSPKVLEMHFLNFFMIKCSTEYCFLLKKEAQLEEFDHSACTR